MMCAFVRVRTTLCPLKHGAGRHNVCRGVLPRHAVGSRRTGALWTRLPAPSRGVSLSTL